MVSQLTAPTSAWGPEVTWDVGVERPCAEPDLGVLGDPWDPVGHGVGMYLWPLSPFHRHFPPQGHCSRVHLCKVP